jgi:hypothetical protein
MQIPRQNIIGSHKFKALEIHHRAELEELIALAGFYEVVLITVIEKITTLIRF